MSAPWTFGGLLRERRELYDKHLRSHLRNAVDIAFTEEEWRTYLSMELGLFFRRFLIGSLGVVGFVLFFCGTSGLTFDTELIQAGTVLGTGLAIWAAAFGWKFWKISKGPKHLRISSSGYTLAGTFHPWFGVFLTEKSPVRSRLRRLRGMWILQVEFLTGDFYGSARVPFPESNGSVAETYHRKFKRLAPR